MEEIGANESFINNLPDDCLERIFTFLPIWERLEIEGVCKCWRIVGERGWNDIKELKIHRDYSNNLIHLILKRCGRFLRKLIICLSRDHLHCLSMVIKFCQLDQLEEIEMINMYFKKREDELNIRNLRKIFEKSGKLIAVTITGRLDQYMLDYLNFLNPKNLRKLDLRNTSWKSLSINPDRFPNLKELNLYGIDIIEDGMIRGEDSLKGLEKMDIGRCVLVENFTQRICTFTNLQELALRHHAIHITNEVIRDIARHCDKIKKMGLRNFATPTSDCFKYLGEMPSLEILNFNIFDMDTSDLVYLTNVKKISFYRCNFIVAGNGLIELIANSSNLEELEFYGMSDVGRPFLDNVERIFQLGQRNRHLVIIFKGRDYERLDDLGMLGTVTYHPLLDLRVDTDINDSENSDHDYEDDEDDDDDNDNIS